MATKKTSKLTTKPRKKSSTRSSKSTSKSTASKKKAEELEDRRKLMELTLKGFQMTYEAYQQGKFHRIL
jgi:hypothetical protein